MKHQLTLLGILLSVPAFSQYSAGFESSEGYSGSATGTIITGVNGWYVPVAGSNDGRVYSYAGNDLGLSTNPQGGSQFLGTRADWVNATAGYARAQRDTSFGTGKWSVTFDFNGTNFAAPPATDNLGSFSLQPSGACNYFQTLYHWTDVNNPTTFTFDYGVAPATGVSGAFTTFYSAGPEWANLPVNHWYRCNTTWDGTTNQVLSVSIQDLTTGGAKTTVSPTDWYLSGGLNNVLAQANPTAIRFFCGGTVDGNVVGYDNLQISHLVATVLTPTSFNVGLGSQVSGNINSLAADDGNALKICKAFVPNFTSPRIRLDATYLSPFLSAAIVQLDMKARMTTGGSFKVRGFLADTSGSGTFTYGAPNQVIADTSIALTFASYTSGAVATGTHIDTDADATPDGTIVARTEIQQTGFSAVAVPCAEWELMTVTVTP